MFIIPDIRQLKKHAHYLPDGLVDYMLAHGRVEGNKLVLDRELRKEIQEKFPDFNRVKLDLNRLMQNQHWLPLGCLNYILGRGEVRGDFVMLDAIAMNDILRQFPLLGQVKLGINQMRTNASKLPEGYVDFVLAHAKIDGDVAVLDVTVQARIREKFPELEEWSQVTGKTDLNLLNLHRHQPKRAKSGEKFDVLPKIVECNLRSLEKTVKALGPTLDAKGTPGVANPNFVIYTAALSNKPLHPIPEVWKELADFVVFQSDSNPSLGWQSRPSYRRFKQPKRNLLHHKALPHVCFPDVEFSLWLDSNIVLKFLPPLEYWLKKHLQEYDLVVFKHALRTCCYQEAAECIRSGDDATEKIDGQMKKYFADGHPASAGLADPAVLLRRHTPKVQQFNEIWHEEISKHSHCEQLSLDYVAKKAGIKYACFPGTVFENPYFIRLPVVEVKETTPPMAVREQIKFDKPDAIILSHPRSGTHFLQASLASHPRVHPRNEFLRRLGRDASDRFRHFLYSERHIYSNKPGHFNIGIVMYQDLAAFEQLICPLQQIKVIHLIRNANRVAKSFAQLWADNLNYGKDHRNHYDTQHKALPHVLLTASHVKEVLVEMGGQYASLAHATDENSLDVRLSQLAKAIEFMQQQYRILLNKHPAVMEVSYDDLTGNAQTNQLSSEFSTAILKFLGLSRCILTNDLQKTGSV